MKCLSLQTSIGVTLLGLVAVSCSYDILTDPAIVDDGTLPIRLTGRIEQNSPTRADESGFANGDRIGLYVVNHSEGGSGVLSLSGNHLNNMAMTYSSDTGGWDAVTPIYWLNATTLADFISYYPYQSNIVSISEQPFMVEADQRGVSSAKNMSGYEKSDFLWASSLANTPGERVNLVFHHLMAGVKVTLIKGVGFEAEEWEMIEKNVTIDNTTRECRIDLSDGSVIPYGNYDKNIIMNPEEGDVFRGVTVPQSVSGDKTTIGITIDGKPYKYTRKEGMSYLSGRLHSFTIEVNRSTDGGDYSLRLVSEEILPWESDSSSHDFEANSYLVIHVEKEGTLKEVVTQKGLDPSQIRNLKLTGNLTDEDFQFMREELPRLTAINLKDTKMVASKVGSDWEGWEYVDDRIPSRAFIDNPTLRRVILPEGIKSIGDYAFHGMTLSSALVIPESVKTLEGHCFGGVTGELGSIVMPSSLEEIGDFAFYATQVPFELKLSNTIKHVGGGAFWGARGARGVFNVPQNLEVLSAAAFRECGTNLTGEIVIPAGIKEVPEGCFDSMSFIGDVKVTLPEGLKTIGRSAFRMIRFSESLMLPETVERIDKDAFWGANFPGGKVRIPKGLKYLGRMAFSVSNISGEITFPSELDVVLGGIELTDTRGAFCNTPIERLILPSTVLQIEESAFDECKELKYIEIGKNVAFIGARAFNRCPNIQTVVCLAENPPALNEDNFSTSAMDKVVLEVPEKSIDAYRNAIGWRKFRNITPHRELAFNIPDIACLDKGLILDGIIRSEGAWKVEDCPSWVHVTPDHGSYKEELTVTVDPLPVGEDGRDGRIVFKLDNSGYTTFSTVRQMKSEQEEDKEIVLKQASANHNEIPVFIVGEGFSADEIISGVYMRRVKETVDYFLNIEPFKSFSDLFTFTTSVACSPESGVGDLETYVSNKFNTDGVTPNIGKLRSYVEEVSTHAGRNMQNALIIVVANYPVFAGWASLESDGCRIAVIGSTDGAYPYDQRGLVQHYAGGMAFGGLGPEYISHFENIKGCNCPGCNDLSRFDDMKRRGYFANLSLSSKMSDAPWKDFIFHPDYSLNVDMWEGGYNHFRGIWRSEANSVMNTYIPYFNAISRYTIYKEIMRRSGQEYSLENFIANDKTKTPDE